MKLECLILILVLMLDGFESQDPEPHDVKNRLIWEGAFTEFHDQFVKWENTTKDYQVSTCKKIYKPRKIESRTAGQFKPKGQHDYKDVKCETNYTMFENVEMKIPNKDNMYDNFVAPLLNCRCYLTGERCVGPSDMVFTVSAIKDRHYFIMAQEENKGVWYIDEFWTYAVA